MLRKNPLSTLFQKSAASFFESLTSQDRATIKLARRIFVANTFINLGLYYSCLSPDSPGGKQKFPCTISWTIRKGFTRYSNLVIWSAGWYQMLKLFAKRGDLTAKVFAAQMYAVGLVVCYFAPVGQSRIQDTVHAIGAGLYFVYHCVLFDYVRTTALFRAGFYVSFACFLASLRRIRQIEDMYGFMTESDYFKGSKKGRQNALLMKEPVKRNLRWNKLLQMISENTMFLSFTLGMTSGLGKAHKRLK